MNTWMITDFSEIILMHYYLNMPPFDVLYVYFIGLIGDSGLKI